MYNASSIVSLRAPWPASLGRISPTAAQAVRRAGPNATEVTFAVPEDERHSLLSLPSGRVVVKAMDATAYYETRAAADAASTVELPGRRLAGRSGALPLSSGPPLLGSMGGYYTCARRCPPGVTPCRTATSPP